MEEGHSHTSELHCLHRSPMTCSPSPCAVVILSITRKASGIYTTPSPSHPISFFTRDSRAMLSNPDHRITQLLSNVFKKPYGAGESIISFDVCNDRGSRFDPPQCEGRLDSSLSRPRCSLSRTLAEICRKGRGNKTFQYVPSLSTRIHSLRARCA